MRLLIEMLSTLSVEIFAIILKQEELVSVRRATCRAFLSGLRKKGHDVARETGKDGRSVYRIASAASGERAG